MNFLFYYESELLFYIFFYLPINDLLSIFQVNKRFYQYYSNQLIWKNICLREWNVSV